jgi:predicted metal-dependent hydrolase
MLKENIFVYILIVFIILVCYQIYRTTPYFHLKCIISSKNGNTYCVREREISKDAVDLLAKIDDKCNKLIDYISKVHPNNEDVKRLKENYKDVKIQEILPTSTLTAYTENKGAKIAFCLNKNDKQTKTNKLIEEDVLFFVAMHELGHVMSKSVGHNEEFWSNFKFILQEAKNANMYQPVDYSKEPEAYCGMEINSNPYFN